MAEYDILMSSCSAAYSEQALIQHLILSIPVASCHEAEEDLKDNTDVGCATKNGVGSRHRCKTYSAQDILHY
jgi:hypothetical protein